MALRQDSFSICSSATLGAWWAQVGLVWNWAVRHADSSLEATPPGVVEALHPLEAAGVAHLVEAAQAGHPLEAACVALGTAKVVVVEL